MFLQGFLFALGFGVGCIFLSCSVATTLLAIEKLALRLRKSKETDRTVDIRRWQERRFARRTNRESPRNAG